jgi:hypothetical protein
MRTISWLLLALALIAQAPATQPRDNDTQLGIVSADETGPIIRGDAKHTAFTTTTDPDGERALIRVVREVWSLPLEEGYFPTATLVSPDGEHVVALGNTNDEGEVDKALRVYTRKGLVKSYTLAGLLGVTQDAVDECPFTADDWFIESVSRFDTAGGKPAFCLWLAWKREWLAWSLADGAAIEKPDARDVARWNEAARQSARQAVVAAATQPADAETEYDPRVLATNTAVKLLTAVHEPADRALLAALAEAPTHFYSSETTGDDGAPIHIALRSDLRLLADRALSRWDGEAPAAGDPDIIEEAPQLPVDDWSEVRPPHHLGKAEGALRLPPVEQGGGVLVIYLVPHTVHRDRLTAEAVKYMLRIDCTPELLEKKSLTYAFEAIEPGQYWLQAFYADQAPEVEEWSPTKAFLLPSPRFRSEQSEIILIDPGGTDGVTLDCGVEVKP